jgi:hypothetical protein
MRTSKRFEVQVHHLISLGGWNDVIYLSIYPPLQEAGAWLTDTAHVDATLDLTL